MGTVTSALYFDIPEFLFYETSNTANDMRPQCPIVYEYIGPGTSRIYFDNVDFSSAVSGTKGTADAVYRATLNP